jgi:hypothetical protein
MAKSRGRGEPAAYQPPRRNSYPSCPAIAAKHPCPLPPAGADPFFLGSPISRRNLGFNPAKGLVRAFSRQLSVCLLKTDV